MRFDDRAEKAIAAAMSEDIVVMAEEIDADIDWSDAGRIEVLDEAFDRYAKHCLGDPADRMKMAYLGAYETFVTDHYRSEFN